MERNRWLAWGMVFVVGLGVLGRLRKTPSGLGSLEKQSAQCLAHFKEESIEHCVRYRFAKNLTHGLPALDGDLVHAVIEIPKYTRAKWEVEKTTGELVWDFKKNRPRLVQALIGYPVNYGMVPQTLTPKKKGWDGDPLDILVLGGPVSAPGTILKTRIIGVMHMSDDFKRDDKLIAIRQADPDLSEFGSFHELLSVYRGADRILSTWFENYKYPRKRKETIVVSGFSGPAVAKKILEEAMQTYQASLK